MQVFPRDVWPELQEDRAKSTLSGLDQPVADGQADAGVAGRIVKVGECARSDVAKNVGIIRLPLVGVVVFADDIGGQSVERLATQLCRDFGMEPHCSFGLI